TPASARKPVRRPPARTRRPSVGAQIGRALSAIPIPPEVLRRAKNWTLGLLLAGGLAAGVAAMGVPQMIGMAAAHGIGAMGFVVRNIQPSGLRHVNRDAVYRIAMDARGQDMPLVDLSGIRRALLELPWVADARVSRRLPDTLVIDLVERKPAGIWQYQQRLQLIDDHGEPIAAVDPQTIPDQLPLVIGPDANRHAGDFQKLAASQPALKPLIEAATWIGGRRWDLRFQSGETLSLPEGEAEARAALASFTRRDAEARLLGRGIARFDMRDPSRIVVKMSEEPGYRVPDPVAPVVPDAAPAVGKTVT
uniref:cell division protein FtsQ/DivIB n=1 Tax=Sphingomonas bacterium TaxID=1895847 RepID=UPI0020C73A0E